MSRVSEVFNVDNGQSAEIHKLLDGTFNVMRVIDPVEDIQVYGPFESYEDAYTKACNCIGLGLTKGY